jgi:hypothetical protein
MDPRKPHIHGATGRRKPPGTFWPTEQQETLLVAALAEPEAAEQAWRSLPPSFTIEALEPGSFEALALVYQNLSAAGFADATHGKLKGIYRRSWLKNQLLLQRSRDTDAALSAAGIRALFLEGPTLALRYYPELGLRPASFVHVLVNREDADAAVAPFLAAGWTDQSTPGHVPRNPRFFGDDDGHIGVLRTSIASDFILKGDHGAAQAPIWEGAERQDLGDVELLVPNSTDLLLAVCSLGARRTSGPSVQWILDAAMILRGEGGVDGPRLLELARGSGQELRLRDSLEYLTALPGIQAPEGVLPELEAIRLHGRQRLAHSFAGGALHRLGPAPELVSDHLAATRHKSAIRTVTGFPGFLRARWNLERASQLPLAAGRRALRLVAAARRTDS